jgi:hypothetical protein
MLEFLGFPGRRKLLEADLEKAHLDHLQEFLLELGRGFAFVGRQYRVSSESKDLYIDLVFYNYLLKCFVLFDLKSGELTHQDIGQMDMYVRMMDVLKRSPDDHPTVGIILCTHKDASVVRYSVLREKEQMFASRYKWSSRPKLSCGPSWSVSAISWRSTLKPQGRALIRPGLHASREGNRSRCQEAARQAFSRYCGR